MTFRYEWRAASYALFLREQYPPFDFQPAAADDGADPHTHVTFTYPEHMSRWQPLVKWLLAIPHYLVLFALGTRPSPCTPNRSGAEVPGHPLWTHFRQITVRSLRASVHHAIGTNPENSGIGAAPRVLAADTEPLDVYDTTTLPDGVWHPDTYSRVVPMVMRFGDNRWRVLNVE